MMASAQGLRIGDADREAMAASLREHFAEGRLTLEEFQQRLADALGARTDRDLAAITGDLPAPSPVARPGGSRSGGQQGQWRRSWPRAVAGIIMIILSLAIVAALLPLAFFGAALSRVVLYLLGLLLFGRRGLLGRLRRWLIARRWPF
jgi:uncharacterized protein DUF1707